MICLAISAVRSIRSKAVNVCGKYTYRITIEQCDRCLYACDMVPKALDKQNMRYMRDVGVPVDERMIILL